MKKHIYEICRAQMTKVHPAMVVSEAITLMRDRQVSCLIVMDAGNLVGIFTERDIVRCMVESGLQFVNYKISQVMKKKIITANDKAFIFEAFDILSSNNIRHLVVLDDLNRPVGIVTLTDLIDHLGYKYFMKVHTVSQIMSSPPMTITPGMTVIEAISDMARFNVSFLIVVDREQPVGVLTEQDVTRLAAGGIDPGATRVREVMSSPVISVTPETPLAEAAKRMRRGKIRRLVVLDQDGVLRGVITQSNFVKAMESRYVDTLKDIIKNQGGQLARAIRKLSEKTLYLDSILSTSIGLGIVAANAEGQIELYNSEAERILGLPVHEIIGQNLHDIHTLVAVLPRRYEPVLVAIQSGRSYSFSFERQVDGEKLFVQALVNGIRDAGGVIGFVIVLQDLTIRKMAEDTIKFLAYHDILTELPNRINFHERLGVELARAKRNGSALAVMVLDLNKFKEVNDTLGHFAGDQLLREQAARMRGILRESDTVARVGGDEFIFILPEIGGHENSQAIAHNILREIEKPLCVEGATLISRASIGIAVYPVDAEDSEDLLRLADNAMYRAKDLSRQTDGSAVAVCSSTA